MLNLEWKPIGKLGRLIISKETKELDSKNIILNEKFVDALNKKVEIFNSIVEQIEKEGYPSSIILALKLPLTTLYGILQRT